MIYVNGCSYTLTEGEDVGHYLSEFMAKPRVHKGIPGSSNTRILRVTARDLYQAHAQGIEDVCAVIGLSYWYRHDVYMPNRGTDAYHQYNCDDGEFRSCHQELKEVPAEYHDYLKQWLVTRNSQAEICNVLHQCSVLMHTAKQLGYRIVFYWAADVTNDLNTIDPQLPMLSDFYKQFDNTNSFDLLSYSFVNHYYTAGYKPYDHEQWGSIGHPTTEVHRLFAQKVHEKLEAQL